MGRLVLLVSAGLYVTALAALLVLHHSSLTNAKDFKQISAG
jgi:hypothetical protein